MVVSGDDSPHPPLNSPYNPDGEQDGAVSPIQGKRVAVEGRNGDVVAVNKRRPNIDLLMTLVDRRDIGVESDLLAVVRSVGLEPVVVNADVAVGVPGDDGDLDVGGQDVGGGEVEAKDCGFLEHESGFGGLKNGPDEEDGEEEDEEENQTARNGSADYLSSPLLVVGTLLRRHGLFPGGRGWKGSSEIAVGGPRLIS
ncbi:unnamed protein product [Cuscuta europaea]|uniref:Uncharacterized protein n=1 Tax=Cuscuta europaea TaxID=41803 RepID=A0A9P0ZWN8_CUSEU|nr:unnamed protein product [Cuscuta europaea]